MSDKKYYDAYITTTGDFDYTKGQLGDATRETIKGTGGGAAGMEIILTCPLLPVRGSAVVGTLAMVAVLGRSLSLVIQAKPGRTAVLVPSSSWSRYLEEELSCL